MSTCLSRDRKGGRRWGRERDGMGCGNMSALRVRSCYVTCVRVYAFPCDRTHKDLTGDAI